MYSLTRDFFSTEIVCRIILKQTTIFRYCPTLAKKQGWQNREMIEVYKILTGKYDPTSPSILDRNINSTTRGNPLKLCTYRPKYDLCKYNFTVRIITH